jgi:hypothetical protein
MGLWKNGHNMWILQRKNVDQRTIDKVEEEPPIVFSVLREWQSSVVESSYNTARAGSSFRPLHMAAINLPTYVNTYHRNR